MTERKFTRVFRAALWASAAIGGLLLLCYHEGIESFSDAMELFWSWPLLLQVVIVGGGGGAIITALFMWWVLSTAEPIDPNDKELNELFDKRKEGL